MKNTDKISYTDKIKRRIRILWGMIAAMLVYMVVVGETGGDSRIMTDLAAAASRVIFFGGFIYIISRILHNKRLLRNRPLLKEQMRMEQDERNQYLHDKSGGIVADILLMVLLFTTLTAALYNMAAFYTSVFLLCVTILLKITTYYIFSRII